MIKISKKFCLVAAFLSTAALVSLEIFHPAPFSSESLNTSFFNITTRAIGAALFIIVVIYLEHDIFKIRRAFSRRALCALPCLAVALNNLPYVALIRRDAYVDATSAEIMLFAAECVLVAIFEETAFRGVVFLSILKNRKTKKGIFISIIISSAVFGLFHLINLFYGENFGSVALQVGYSTLVGAMCSFVLLKTGCLWICVAVHAVYNFCGMLVPRLGGGKMLNAPQIIITVIISVFCAIYILKSLLKTPPSSTDKLYNRDETSPA